MAGQFEASARGYQMPPTKTPALNADARAVLLEAILPTDDLPAAFIMCRGDLRRAQFDKGEERLRGIGLLEGDTYNLTDEGIRVARELQENEARLTSGIRYDEREAAIRMRGGRETARVPDEWQPCQLDGQPAFTNGFILCLGYAPSDNRLEKTFPPANIQKAWEAGAMDAPVKVFPVAYSEQQGWKERKRTVWLSDGACVDAEAFTFVMQRTPGATITHEATPSPVKCSQRKALNFYVDGRRAAMLMPYQLDAPAGVAAILKAQGGQAGEQLRPVQTDADRAARVGRYLGGRISGKADSIEADYSFHQHADRLAELVGFAKYADMLAALREKPAHCLTWLLLCWQAAGRELEVCTGRTRGEWLGMIDEPGGQGEAEEERAARARPTPEPAPAPPFDSGRATQLGLVF